jgi:hypothetical protein
MKVRILQRIVGGEFPKPNKSHILVGPDAFAICGEYLIPASCKAGDPRNICRKCRQKAFDISKALNKIYKIGKSKGEGDA